MKAALWDKLALLYEQAVALRPDDRRTFLDETCTGDPDLRRELESLLAHADQGDAFFEHLAVSLPFLSPSDETPFNEADPYTLSGTSFSHYEVHHKLGSGGMGVVYKAYDTNLRRPVALKFLPPLMSDDDEARQRFIAEAQAASALDHLNICTIYEIGQTDAGQTFIAMACYEGETLKQKITQGPLPVEEAIPYAMQIARGLSRAHAKGIVHRDVKPANVMITHDGIVKMLDFGLAKMADVQLTRTGTTMGTVAYMSPEQTHGDPVDHRTDIWSLGVVLYEMLTGVRPFRGDYDQAVIYAILNIDVPPLSQHNPDMPDALEHIVSLCLEKDRDLRYPSMDDLLADLDVCVQSSGASQVTDRRPAARPMSTKQRRNTIAAAATGLLVLVLLLPASRNALLRTFGMIPATTYVAVLPFDTDLPEDQALADGLMRSLTSTMARLEAQDPPLWVVPAEEVRLKGVETAADARALFGVNRVVTGHVQRLGAETQLILNLVAPDSDRPRIIETQTITAPLGTAFQEEAMQALENLLDVGRDAASSQAVHAVRPTTPGAYEYTLRGVGYLQRYDKPGNIDNAIQLFSEALDEDSLYAPAYAGLCEAFWQQAQGNKEAWADKARASCDRALALNDALAAVHITRSRILHDRGRDREAEAELRRALELEPNNTDAYRWLGWIYRAQGKTDQAEEAYKQAIRLKPDYWLNYSNLGSFYFYAGRMEEAGEQYEHILRLTPDNYIGYNNLGIQRLDTGQDEEARRLLERSIELKPDDNFLAYLNLGRLHFRAGRYAEAARMYEHARDIRENYDNVWRLLGDAYYWAGEHARAEVAWRRFIALAEALLAGTPSEDDKELYGMLAAAYVALGEPEQGRKYLGLAFAEGTPPIFTYHYVGRTYEMLGERDLALPYLARALEGGLPPVRIETDPWLKALRETAAYREVRQRLSETTP